VDQYYNQASLTENCVKLSGLNLIDALYLFYYLSSDKGQQEIHEGIVGAVQPKLPIYNIEKIKVLWPDLQTRQAIAFILGALDNRIDLLKQTNQTLEAIAQTLFKSWFVNFDPVHAKHQGVACAGIDAETAELFPDSFEDSELGLIPKGWEICELSKISELQNGYAFSSKDWNSEGYPVVKIGNVKPGIIDYSGCSFVNAKSVVDLDRFKLTNGDILVGMTGYVGETGLVVNSDVTSYLNQRVGKFKPKNKHDYSSIYCVVRNTQYKAYAETVAHGSAQANISGSDLLKYKFTYSDPRILSAFNAVVKPLIDKITSNVIAYRALSELRDTLLPRLISGKLDVSAIEAQLEETA